MPIKDPIKRREYQRELMRKKRQGLTVSPVSPGLDPNLKVSLVVSPNNSVRPTTVSPVRPQQEMLDRVRPMENVRPCPLNHHSLTDLFKQATIKIKQNYQAIYKDSETAHKCFDCHNRERNYQIMLNLLEKYWIKVKRLEKQSFVGDQKGEQSM